MNFKSTILAAALLISSAVASANTPINLTPVTTTSYSADFTGSAAVNTFDLDLTNFATATDFFAQISANFTGVSGYNVTGVTLDGAAFTPVVNNSRADYWTFDLTSLTSTVHHLVVTGTPMGGAFVGSLDLNVTAVPEPETYGMMLVGLGLVGAIARRRNKA
ncbi:FxDxF family PEP-CTERM protein [Duganella aceris]|jgi:hypothetical protein|uniref:PEP-CTERM sorting domain-containing protein n=1 Tax=Duganella aceris TaxID=2703883 RepID=A0ABX0FV20_9BURK|nr:FxDxF family PEP-CTERM protein [Duganella aceris]NGZ88400.1 PEP-CTERM sorting domain-containing protein [Duganella aceris]